MIRRVLFSLCLVTVMVAGLTVTGAAPAWAGLTPTRTCKNFDTGDHVRRLSVCARIWFSDVDFNQSRAVVEMHTFILVNGHWIDVTSQSITVNKAHFNVQDANGASIFVFLFGASQPGGQSTCRVNGPSGPIACGLSNTGRVAFYSGAFNGGGFFFNVGVDQVSWRDDRGQAHFVTNGDNSSPDKLPLDYCDPSPC
jgi:hypothetical protein